MDFVKLLQIATNVYRTENYIVCQIVGVQHDPELDSAAVSQDAYFARTPARDRLYEDVFEDRINIDGRRLPTNMYSRKYID